MTPRAMALIAAAFHPPIFREMRAAGCHTMSREAREAWLRDRSFSSNGAHRCAETYMETVRYLRRELLAEAFAELSRGPEGDHRLVRGPRDGGSELPVQS